MQGTVLNVAGSLAGLKPKWEETLFRRFPEHFENGSIAAIHVGSNRDADPGMTGGYKIRGSQVAKSALYLELPERILPGKVLADPRLNVPAFETRIASAVADRAKSMVADLVEKGVDSEEAQHRVADSLPKYAYYDVKKERFVAEPVIKGVNDSMFTGMTVPHWNISQIQKVFKQPYLKGYADRLVTKIGVPNIWADIIQIYSAAYEGAARVSNLGHATPEFNTSIAGKRRVGTMLSELINLAIDYETQGPDEQMIAGMGAWLVNNTFGDMDVFARLMLDILMDTLIYFGHPESGFDGLLQIANRDGTVAYYPDDRPPASYLWDNDGAGSGSGPVNQTVGADLLLMFDHFIADKMEELHFLPTSIKVNCGSALYKVLKWSMLSKVYNQNNPLSIISSATEAGNKIVGTMVSQSGNSLQHSFEICPDPMLNPGTPFNDTDEDMMFMTFPSLQSAFEVENVLSDVAMAPVAIENMVLPSAPAYRDGMVRTAMKRIGSLLCPIAKTVHVLYGMGTNSRYTPTGTVTATDVRIVNDEASPVLTKEVE